MHRARKLRGTLAGEYRLAADKKFSALNLTVMDVQHVRLGDVHSVLLQGTVEDVGSVRVGSDDEGRARSIVAHTSRRGMQAEPRRAR